MRVSARERVSLLPFCYHTTRIVTDQHAQGGTVDQADITWLRALKIWWSFSWRAFVLMLLVMVPLEAVFFWYAMSNLPKAGGNPADAMRMAGTMAAIWPIFMAALIALQAQAMRWMLNKARWSDFRVAVLRRDY